MANAGKKLGEFKITAFRCRCGHEWVSRNKEERPRVCPKCKSPNWDKPYAFRRSDKQQKG